MRYMVRYTTKNGDYDREWCHAESAEEAAEIIKREHWNIESIDSVLQI